MSLANQRPGTNTPSWSKARCRIVFKNNVQTHQGCAYRTVSSNPRGDAYFARVNEQSHLSPGERSTEIGAGHPAIFVTQKHSCLVGPRRYTNFSSSVASQDKNHHSNNTASVKLTLHVKQLWPVNIQVNNTAVVPGEERRRNARGAGYTHTVIPAR